jgi:hypothetical protein
VKRRKYKSGTTWCFWRWSEVDSEYITRLHILKTPWFALCLHWINKPDPEPFLHDHPVSFLSIILRGSYTEWRKRGDAPTRVETHRWLNWIRASKNDRHTICGVEPGTLTLCMMGRKSREWGFTIPTPSLRNDMRDGQRGSTDHHGAFHPIGWSMWRDYYTRQRAAKAKSP